METFISGYLNQFNHFTIDLSSSYIKVIQL
jgi:hypothetical protein